MQAIMADVEEFQQMHINLEIEVGEVQQAIQ
jgi:hypothetical protein